MNNKPTNEELKRRVEELEQEILALKKKSIIDSKKCASVEVETENIPEEYLKEIDLQSIVNIDEIQSIMDDFHYLTNMVTAVLDLNGNVLESTGWQDICTKFHRINPQTAQNCTVSDLHLSKNLKPGEYTGYKCKNGLWDVVTPLYVGTKHLGNIYTGQFFYDDDQIDEDFFDKQADIYGFDKKSYLDAFRCIPRYNRETISHLMGFLTKFTAYISRISLANIKLEKEIRERKVADENLQASEENLKNTFDLSPSLICKTNIHSASFVEVNSAVTRILGYSAEEFKSRPLLDFIHPDDKQRTADIVAEQLKGKEVAFFENRYLCSDGSYKWIAWQGTPPDKNGIVTAIGSDINDHKQTEIRLQEVSELNQTIVNSSPIGISIYNSAGDCIAANDTIGEILGTSKDQILQQNFHQIESWKKSGLYSLALSAMKDQERKHLEMHITTTFGKTGYFDCHLVPFLSGNELHLLNTAEDISQRKTAERALLKSEMQLRTLVDSIPDLVWLKDLNGVYLSCNPMFERFFGAKESVIVGKTDYDFVDKDLADFFREHDRRAMAAGNPSINEEWLTFADNGYKGLFETIKLPMYDADGNLIGVLGVARDISKRKNAENALRENEQRYKSAQRMGQVGNWEYDLATEEFWASDQARRMYGFDPESTNFTTDEVENCIPERERVHQALIDLIEQNEPYNLEFDIQPITGPSKRTIRSIAENLFDEKGVPQKVIGVVQDITIQKKAEKEKIHLERQLKQSQKMESIGNLAGGIAHDFNNILSSVIGFTELALDDVSKGTPLEDNLQEVYTAGTRARDLVKQILAFARQSDEVLKPIRVDTISKEVIKLIRSTIPTTIKINQEIKSDSLIMGNPTQVHQVLMNLCTNAAHAMEDTGGVLEIRVMDVELNDQSPQPLLELKSGKYINVIVSDTGAGIPLDIIDSIFDPYFTTKNVGEGTGMGLALAHGIVGSYGGKITVDSELGKGTVFSIYLPVSKNRDNHQPYAKEDLPLGTERILFVDDELPIAKMGSQILERLGYQVTIRTSSVEALELFRSKPNDFDLIVSDMTMPKMTGDDLAMELIAFRSDIPVIICTGYSKKITDEKAAKIGIKAFAYKPVVKADLAKIVRKVLDETKIEKIK